MFGSEGEGSYLWGYYSYQSNSDEKNTVTCVGLGEVALIMSSLFM